MRVMTTDPISLDTVKEFENAPYLDEGQDAEQLRIYFTCESNKLEFEAIADELDAAVSVMHLLDAVYDQAS